MSTDDPQFISLVPKGSPHRVVGERTVMLPSVTLEILTTRLIELDSWVLKELNDPFWRLYLPVSGSAQIWVGNATTERTELLPGGAYVIPPHTTISSENAESFSKWYVHFTLGPAGDRVRPGVFPVELTAEMSAALEQFAKAEKSSFPWSSASLVANALQQLPVEIWTDRRLDSRVERAMDFMHTNLNRKLSTEDVARAAGLSVRNLNHLFNQHVAMPPMRVLLDYRLDKSCRLLRHTDDSIDQVAEDCGFPNRYYFSRMLKQHRGASPAAYRRGQF